VLSEFFNDLADFSSNVRGFFMLFVQTLSELEAFLVPLGYVSFHLVVVMSKEGVLNVLSENLTFD
jgi:hypothetical protein